MRSVAFQMRCVYATEKLYHNNFPLWAAAAAAAAAIGIEKRMRYIFFILPFFIINFPFYLYIQYFFSTFCFSCCCFALHFLFRVYEKYVLFPTLHYYYYDDDDVVFDDILARIASNVRWIHTHLAASGCVRCISHSHNCQCECTFLH